LVRLSEQTLFDYRWGEIDQETLAEAKENLESQNKRSIAEWQKASRDWDEACDRNTLQRSEIDRGYDEAREAWESSLPQHEEAVSQRKEAREAWVAKYNEVFQNWYSEVGVLVGRMKDSFPRGINGYPMFHAMQILHPEDWDRVSAAVVREQERSIVV
jgi:hypothetical protein